MNPTYREAVELGVLLHNVGKLAWKARKAQAGENPAALGEQFIREHIGTVRAVAPVVEEVVRAARRHSGRIWESDCVAAMEREAEQSQATRRPLIALESRIRVGHAVPAGTWWHPPEVLRPEYEMPRRAEEEVATWKPDEDLMAVQHAALWTGLTGEVHQLRLVEHFEAFYNTLFALLEKYTARVASAGYKALTDISLFDHARTVAAVARCLEEAPQAEAQQVLLVKGDVSGIQSFLYRDVRSIENPAKQLRGRSFYVGLLSDTIAHHLLHELGLQRANLLYSGGGHFVLLVPNAEAARETLAREERMLNRWLLHEFGGSLQVVIAHHAVSADDAITQFDEAYQKLAVRLNQAKRQKGWSVLDVLFEEDELPQRIDQDDSRFHPLGEKLPKIDGGWLVEVRATVRPGLDRNRFPLLAGFEACRTFWYGAEKSELPRLLRELARHAPEYVTAWRLNDTGLLDQAQLLSELPYPLAFAFKFAGLYAPRTSDGGVKDFSALATLDTAPAPENAGSEREPASGKGGAGSLEYPLLGVLRMDIDDLGALFALGLKEQTEGERLFTIARIAMLSRNLYHFFCGHLNGLAGRYQVYVAYSGGDDLFAVGSWPNIIAFAQAVRRAFEAYACHNPNFTLSGGTVFSKPTYPIPLSAADAGRREEEAKQAPGKDHVSVFNRTVSWEELSEHLGLAEQLLGIVEDGEGRRGATREDRDRMLPRSFVHQLLRYTRSCFVTRHRDGSEQVQFDVHRFQRVNRLLHYAFARRKVSAKEIEARTLGFKTELARYLLGAASLPEAERTRRLGNFDIVASYVLLKTRQAKA